MSRIRLILLSALAVCAVSAVASASALAASEYHICKSNKAGKYQTNKCNTLAGVKEFEFEKLVSPAKEKIEGTGGVTVLEGYLSGYRDAIECKKSGFKGEIESEGASGSEEVKLEECGDLLLIENHQAPKKTTCEVGNLYFSVKSQLVSGNGSGPEYEIKPASGGTVLLESEFTGASCTWVVPKRFKVEVKAANEGIVCAFPEYAVGKEEHEVSCSSTDDGSLSSFGKPLSFTNVEKVKLSSGVGWYVE
jgi:hypothetical protein